MSVAMALAIVAVTSLGHTDVSAATYNTTGTLNDLGYCIGYGWADSQYPYGVYAGTTRTGGTGPCYRNVDSYIHYNGNDFNPGPTGYQSYDVAQGAGPGGSGDYVYGQHWIAWQSPGKYGTTYASD